MTAHNNDDIYRLIDRTEDRVIDLRGKINNIENEVGQMKINSTIILKNLEMYKNLKTISMVCIGIYGLHMFKNGFDRSFNQIQNEELNVDQNNIGKSVAKIIYNKYLKHICKGFMYASPSIIAISYIKYRL
jgi:hypothetical protein